MLKNEDGQGTKKKRTADEKMRDQEAISALYLQGWQQMEIARELKLTEAMVSRDLKALRERWVKNADFNMDQKIGRELARIDRIEREAWEAWEKSKAPVESTTQAGGEGIPGRASKTKTTRTGDKRYLDVVCWCVEQRVKLLGLVTDKHELIGTVKLEWVDPLGDDDDIGIGADELPATGQTS